jgi:hypothetical protein
LILLLGMLTASCGAPAATPEPDRIATRVAEELAVSQTLTAVARTANAPTLMAAVSTQSPRLPASPNPPATVASQTKPPAGTLVPVKTQLPAPLEDPTTGGFGDPKGLTGKILLPGYLGAQIVDSPVFSESIVFRLFVFDTSKGNHDGDGITSVDISITDPNGKGVSSRTEGIAGYCAFGGGEPNCNVWHFAEHNNQWPDGTSVCAGEGYQAGMTVHTADKQKEGAFWGFNFSIQGDYPPCQ